MPSPNINVTWVAGIIVSLSLLVVLTISLYWPRSQFGRIPHAHWTSGISSGWILWIRYKGKELVVLQDLHRKLGPILRLGPSDLSISCYELGVRTVYNGGYEKPSYYDFFSYYGRKNAFCSQTRADHSLRRRRITAAYTKSSLFASDQLFSVTSEILTKRLLPILRNQTSFAHPTDVLRLSYGVSLDLLTSFQFGLTSGSDFLRDKNQLELWLRHYERRYCKEAFWPQELPSLTRWLKMIGIDMLPSWQYESTEFLENWLLQLCDQAEETQLGGTPTTSDTPVVYELAKNGVEADMPDASPDDKKREIASELFDHMSGGREVLGLVIAYTIFYISQNLAAQRKLQAELFALGHNWQECLPSPGMLDRLPYLSAVLKESFRMRPNSTPLPRRTPNHEVSLGGFDGISPNTRVNTFQWFLHRDPDRYKEPNEWQPERWLEEESKDGKLPPPWAFGGGSRTCVEISLTQYLMRYILAVIYVNFTTKVMLKKDGTFEPGSFEDEILVQFERQEDSSMK